MDMIAVITSVIQNAFQTPTAPRNLLSKNAAGMITTTYRQREISKEGVPFPSPSNAPEEVTETAETINPAPMMRKAVSPGLDRRFGVGKQPYQLAGDQQTYRGSKHHNDTAHAQNNLINLADSFVLPCTVVIADQGAHPLHNAIRRKIDEGLQFVIDPQNQNIHFGR